jgi:hypothetical protein
MTTAELTKAARKAQAELDWPKAAELWTRAIDVHPFKDSGSPMYDAHIATLTEHAESCRSMIG